MNRKSIASIGLVALLVTCSLPAFAWEKGTHAFIAEQLRKSGTWQTLEGSYGAVAPDMFIYWFSEPYSLYRDFLYDQTHFNVSAIWNAVRDDREKPAAIGFLSHNNVWGADATAHTRARTTGLNEGYAITKGAMLHAMLMQDPDYAALMGNAEDVSLAICHELVEAAGDMVLMQYDPSVGKSLAELARARHSSVGDLMARAYARPLASFSKNTTSPLTVSQSAELIRAAEAQLRDETTFYASLLGGGVDSMMAYNIERYKVLAGAFLASYGLPVPDEATLTALVTGALQGAVAVVRPDYVAEVLATVGYVRAGLREHRIR
jgi:hypothetical protein